MISPFEVHPSCSLPRPLVQSGRCEKVRGHLCALTFTASLSPHPDPLTAPSQTFQNARHRPSQNIPPSVRSCDRKGGLFLHTSPPTNKSQFTLPLSLLALPALLVRSSSHLERGDSTGNAGMRLRSNRKRTVIFRTRLHPEQSEASLWSVVSTPSPALDCTAFLSLGVFSPTL